MNFSFRTQDLYTALFANFINLQPNLTKIFAHASVTGVFSTRPLNIMAWR